MRNICPMMHFQNKLYPLICRCMRCPVRDMEEEDIAQYFDAARAFIDEARSSGGAVLVHCHEGKSRSVTLVLAYFMQTKVTHLQIL